MSVSLLWLATLTPLAQILLGASSAPAIWVLWVMDSIAAVSSCMICMCDTDRATCCTCSTLQMLMSVPPLLVFVVPEPLVLTQLAAFTASATRDTLTMEVVVKVCWDVLI